MAETVSLNKDGRRATITGRKRASLQQKMNPVWWFMNSSEQTVNEAPWYRPAWPYWRRWLYWSLRNPLQNLRAFVVGVSDKNYNIIGRAPVMCVQRNDLLPSETGFQWCVLHGGDLRMRRFFVSYSGNELFGISVISRLGFLDVNSIFTHGEAAWAPDEFRTGPNRAPIPIRTIPPHGQDFSAKFRIQSDMATSPRACHSPVTGGPAHPR